MDNKDLPGITNETIKITLKEEYFDNINIMGEALNKHIKKNNRIIRKLLDREVFDKYKTYGNYK